MKIKKIFAKNILIKSNLPECDFVINPYTGCTHGCIYCYARFMKRFTNHQEGWGQFVDIKINAPSLISPKIDLTDKTVVIGSVTDPYQPLEQKYKLTRQILEKLIVLKPKRLDILTKSDLVLRDIDLIKQFKNSFISLSFSSFDQNLAKKLEPGASLISKRLEVLKQLFKNGIKTILFISPILPFFTDWQKIIENSKDFVFEYWFENLNFYPSVRDNLYKFINQKDKKLISQFKNIYFKKNNFWDQMEEEIQDFCLKEEIKYELFFHHKRLVENKKLIQNK